MKKIIFSSLLLLNVFALVAGGDDDFHFLYKNDQELLDWANKYAHRITNKSYCEDAVEDIRTLFTSDSEQLIEATQTGDLVTLQNIFSKKDKPESWIVDRAFQEAFNAKQPKKVLLFLLKNSSTKGSVFRAACTSGQIEMVKLFLEADATTHFMDSIANHEHIREAKDKGHLEVAKMIQAHLVAKGYGYASTIQLDQK